MICPYCSKKSRDNFEYCRHCGSKLSGEIVGDFKTDYLNVFRHSDEYIYIYAVNGNQVVLRADSLDELAGKVSVRNFPWVQKGLKSTPKKAESETVKVPVFESEFLKASSLQRPQVIGTSSSKKSEKNNVSQKEVSRVGESSIDFSSYKEKRNPSKSHEISEDEISKEYGIRGVSRKDGQWAFRTNDLPYTLKDDYLRNLQNKVEAKQIDWVILDEDLAREAFNIDKEKLELRDREIMKKRLEKKEFYENKDKQIRESSQKRAKEVEDMLEQKNMDRLLK